MTAVEMPLPVLSRPTLVRDDQAGALSSLVAAQLALLGEDPTREGLRRTPQRVAESLTWLTRGYHMWVAHLVGEALFAEEHEQMVRGRFRDCAMTRAEFLGLAHRG